MNSEKAINEIPPEHVRLALRDFYKTSDVYAAHLEKETEAYFTRYLRLIDQYAPQAETLLDAGCGTGLSSYMLSLRRRRVIGTDLSEFFLRKASPLQQSPNLLRSAGDIMDLPFRDSQFDFVGSYLVISFIPDIERALKEIVRVLKPGGVVLIVTPNQASPLWPLKDFLRMLARGKSRSVFCETPAGALKTAWNNLCFSFRKCRETRPQFEYIQPDLTCRRVVGGESDAVYRSSTVDFERFFRKEEFEILRKGSQDNWFEKLLPLWAGSIEFVSRKPHGT